MQKIFNDAYKSNLALIVLDSIERLVEYAEGANIFNNYVLQNLMCLIQNIPSRPQCRLVIIGTSSNYGAMKLLEVNKIFNLKLEVPLLG